MRARCPEHNRQMRWYPARNLWVCPMRGCTETAGDPSPRARVQAKARQMGIVAGLPARSDVKIYPDGREVLSSAAKRGRWRLVWQLDKGRCVGCGKSLDPPYSASVNAAEIHHVASRGMSGWKRDDRVFVGGKRNLETRCPGPQGCHRKAGPQIQSARIDRPQKS